MEELERSHKNNLEGQLDLFSLPSENGEVPKPSHSYTLPPATDFTQAEKLAMEKEVTGIYVTGHPLQEYRALAERIQADSLSKFLEAAKVQGTELDGKPLKLLGIITEPRTKMTKNNETMAFAKLEDLTASCGLLIFPKVCQQVRALVREGQVVVLKGRATVREEEEPKIIVEMMTAPANYSEPPPAPPAPPAAGYHYPAANKGTGKKALYLRVESRQSPAFQKAQQILLVFEGMTPVYFYLQEEKKYLKAPQGMWVDPNVPMIRELQRVLGEENVVFKNIS